MLSILRGRDPEVRVALRGSPSLTAQVHGYANLRSPTLFLGDQIRGEFSVQPPSGGSISHQGISLKIFGQYQSKSGEVLSRFLEQSQSFLAAGDLSTAFFTAFSFNDVVLPTGSFYGPTLSVAYGLEVKMLRRFGDFVHCQPFVVFGFDDGQGNEPIHNEIGISGVLQYEFIFSRRKFDCHDMVIGVVYPTFVRIRIVHMQLSLYCAEQYVQGGRLLRERTKIATTEIMDGPPVRGDKIPIRFFLGDWNVWPYLDFVGSAVRVDWYFMVRLIDDNGKKYYKRLKPEIVRLPFWTDEATR
jgi:vacuolar protein sorting-associated protein 26